MRDTFSDVYISKEMDSLLHTFELLPIIYCQHSVAENLLVLLHASSSRKPPGNSNTHVGMRDQSITVSFFLDVLQTRWRHDEFYKNEKTRERYLTDVFLYQWCSGHIASWSIQS